MHSVDEYETFKTHSGNGSTPTDVDGAELHVDF